jgi:hypothetical protein
MRLWSLARWFTLGLGAVLLGCSAPQPWPADLVHELQKQCERNGPARDPVCAVETALACYARDDHNLCEAVDLELYGFDSRKGVREFRIERVLDVTESNLTSSRRWLHRLHPGNVHVIIKVNYCDPEFNDCREVPWTREGYTLAKVGDRWHVIEQNVGRLADFMVDVVAVRIDIKMMETLRGCYQQTLECAIRGLVVQFLLHRPEALSSKQVVESTGSWVGYFVVNENEKLENRVDRDGVEHDEMRYVSFKAGLAGAEYYADEIVDWYNYDAVFVRNGGVWEAQPGWLID